MATATAPARSATSSSSPTAPSATAAASAASRPSPAPRPSCAPPRPPATQPRHSPNWPPRPRRGDETALAVDARRRPGPRGGRRQPHRHPRRPRDRRPRHGHRARRAVARGDPRRGHAAEASARSRARPASRDGGVGEDLRSSAPARCSHPRARPDGASMTRSGARPGGDGPDADPPRRLDGHDRPLLVGVDVGGSKIAVLVVDRDEHVLARHVAPTAAGAPERAVDEIAAVVNSALADAGATADDIAALGVGVPGRVDPLTGSVTLAVNLGWQDLPLGAPPRSSASVARASSRTTSAPPPSVSTGAASSATSTTSPTSRSGPASRPASSSTAGSIAGRAAWPARSATSSSTRAAPAARAASTAASRPSSRARPSPARARGHKRRTGYHPGVDGRAAGEAGASDAAQADVRRSAPRDRHRRERDRHRCLPRRRKRRPPRHRDRRRRRPPVGLGGPSAGHDLRRRACRARRWGQPCGRDLRAPDPARAGPDARCVGAREGTADAGRSSSCCRPVPMPVHGAQWSSRPPPMPGSEPVMDGRRWATYVTRNGPSPERSHQVNLKGATPSMRKHRYIALTALFALVVSACNSAASPSPSARPGGHHGPGAARSSASAEPQRVAPLPPAPPPSRRIRPRRSSRASSRTPRSASGRSSCRRPSTSTSRTRSPASRRPIRASRSSGKTTRRPSRTTSTTRSTPASRPTSSTSRSARAGSATTRARACSSASTASSRRPSRTSTSRASGTSSWSTARTSSSRGTRASTSS